MKRAFILLPHIFCSLLLSGCAVGYYPAPYAGPVYYDDAYYDVPDVPPYYVYGGVQYYYSGGGNYYYFYNNHRCYVSHLPSGGRYWHGGRYPYNGYYNRNASHYVSQYDRQHDSHFQYQSNQGHHPVPSGNWNPQSSQHYRHFQQGDQNRYQSGTGQYHHGQPQYSQPPLHPSQNTKTYHQKADSGSKNNNGKSNEKSQYQ